MIIRIIQILFASQNFVQIINAPMRCINIRKSCSSKFLSCISFRGSVIVYSALEKKRWHIFECGKNACPNTCFSSYWGIVCVFWGAFNRWWREIVCTISSSFFTRNCQTVDSLYFFWRKRFYSIILNFHYGRFKKRIVHDLSIRWKLSTRYCIFINNCIEENPYIPTCSSIRYKWLSIQI